MNTEKTLSQALDGLTDEEYFGDSGKFEETIQQFDRDDFSEPGVSKFVPPKLGRLAEEAGNLRIGPGKILWWFDGGKYRPDGSAWLDQFVRDHLGDGYRRNRRVEVEAFVGANMAATLVTQPATDYINLSDGLLYWREDVLEVRPHTPDVQSIIQMPLPWDPSADCPKTRAFFAEHLPADCQEFIFEWLGYLLVPTTKYRKALLLQGPSGTGKSTLLDLVTALLGGDNTSNESLQSLTDGRFAAANLYGKLANIRADLDTRTVQNAGIFKELVSGDRMTVEKKYQHPFSYRPFSRLMFSANEAPGAAEQSDAYYDRWLVLPMHTKVRRRVADFGYLLRPELPGVLRLAVEGLRRLEERDGFEVPESMLAAAADYQSKTDSVVGWVGDTCVFDRDKKYRASELYDNYTEWARANGRKPLGSSKFREHLVITYPALEKGRTDGYDTVQGLHMRGHV